MTATTDNDHYTIEIAISDWLFIDGSMDNHIHAAIHGYLDNEEQGDDQNEEDDDEEDDDWNPDEFADGFKADELDEDELGELPAVAELGKSIRQAGWDQIPGWPADAAGFATWPAPGQVALITLGAAQWALVIAALLRGGERDADMDEEFEEDATRSWAIAAGLQGKLVERGWFAHPSTGEAAAS
jgi:hypothetical protein